MRRIDRRASLSKPSRSQNQNFGHNWKNELLKLVPGLSYSLILMIIFIIIKPNYYEFIGIITLSYSIGIFYKLVKKKDDEGIIKGFIMTFIVASIIYWLAVFSGKYGFIGLLFFVLVIVTYKIVVHRSAYMESLRKIESMIFGKPLDREHWNPGELKKTKVKIKWRKKNE